MSSLQAQLPFPTKLDRGHGKLLPDVTEDILFFHEELRNKQRQFYMAWLALAKQPTAALRPAGKFRARRGIAQAI